MLTIFFVYYRDTWAPPKIDGGGEGNFFLLCMGDLRRLCMGGNPKIMVGGWGGEAIFAAHLESTKKNPTKGNFCASNIILSTVH